LALRGRDLIADRVGVSSAAPDDMTGSMASLPLWQLEGLASGEALSPVLDYLMDQGFETLVSVWPAWPDQVLRVSAHLYNTVDDFVALASVLTRRPISR
jgi:isopenicillin-N epimerase